METESKPPAILTTVIGNVMVIAYNRPHRRNAWNVSTVRESIAAIKQANEDPAIGAIVITGEGASYCAGADLKEDPEYDPVTNHRMTPATLSMGQGDHNWTSLLSRSKPVICAINGPAHGIGATHTLSADIRVIAASASFSFAFLKLKVMPECGSTALLPRLIGAGRANNILLRGGTISAQQALDWGLVTDIFPDEGFRESAIALAQELADLPRLQMQFTKQMLATNAEQGDPEAIMRCESQTFVAFLKAMKKTKPL